MAGKKILFIFCCIMLNGSITGFPLRDLVTDFLFFPDADVSDSGSGIKSEGFINLNDEDYFQLDLENDEGVDTSRDTNLPKLDLWMSSGEVEYKVSEHDVKNTKSGNALSEQLEPEQEMTVIDISGKNAKNVSGIMIKEEQISPVDNQRNTNMSAGYLFQRQKDITHAPITDNINKDRFLRVFPWVLIGCGGGLAVLFGGIAIYLMMRYRRRTSGFRFQNLQESWQNDKHSKHSISDPKLVNV